MKFHNWETIKTNSVKLQCYTCTICDTHKCVSIKGCIIKYIVPGSGKIVDKMPECKGSTNKQSIFDIL